MGLLDLREPASTLTHLAGMVLALPGTWVLWKKAQGDRPRQLSLLIFGLGLAICYGASALYHAVQARGGALGFYYLLDHVGIYILIAGTYTPVAWNLLNEPWRGRTLTLAWLGAVVGAALHLRYGALPPWICTTLYLVMGWGAIFVYAEIARRVPRRILRPLLMGGFLYSIGAAINLAGQPAPWPGVFGAHEVFHLFVLAGSLSHYRFMIEVVLPAPHLAGPSAIPRPAFLRRRPGIMAER